MRDKAMRIAVAQVHCSCGDLEANFDMTLEQSRLARARGAELVVFPELSLTGYCLGDAYPDASLGLDDPRWTRLLRASQEIAMAVGFVEETPDHRFYNSAAVLADGKFQHVHRKLYLPTYGQFDEGKYFGAGKTLRAVDTPVGRIAILICADAWHPSLPYLAAHDGADLLLVMAASSRHSINSEIDTHDAWRRLTQTHALTLGHFVVFANHVGREGGAEFSGGSHIVDATGRILAECSQRHMEMQLADYDAAAMRKQRIALPFRRDDKLEMTLRLGREVAQRRAHPLGLGHQPHKPPTPSVANGSPSPLEGAEDYEPSYDRPELQLAY